MLGGRDPSTCTHTRMEYVWEEDEDPETGEMVGHYEQQEFSTEEDLDLHRTKCSQCGKIGYYSGAARAYYEQGIRSPGIPGLE